MCGLAGIITHKDPYRVAQFLYMCGYNLLHRGQDAGGMMVEHFDGSYILRKGPGTIDRVFLDVDLRAPEWRGYAGLLHTRYATSGVDFKDPRSLEESTRAAQPMVIRFHGEDALLIYNGNLTPSYVHELHQEIFARDFQGEMNQREAWVDTELIVRAIEQSSARSLEAALIEDVCPRLRGAFALIVLYRGTLYAIRDTHGFLPLEIGKYDGGYVVASEDNVFGSFPAGKKVRSVKPGECVIFSRREDRVDMESIQWGTSDRTHFCQFEQIYFLRFDSHTEGGVVAAERKELGRVLCRECPPPLGIDFVIGVPDSGQEAGYGYALEADIPFDPLALKRLHGAGRTFIEPVNDLRKEGVDFKLRAVPKFLEGKRVIVVDDSLVRGTVAARLVYILKESGAQEVHIRVASPPTRYGCWYGKDTNRIEDELLAKGVDTVEEILQKINALIIERYGKPYILDSLCFISLAGMQSVWKGKLGLCDACWTGNYPVL